MSQQSLVINDFSGNIATLSKKKDIPFSARFVKGLNPFEDPSELVPFAKPTNISGEICTSLPKWGVDASPWSTDRYFTDEEGNILKLTSGGTFTEDRSGGTIANGCAGQGLLVFNDYLHYATSTTIGRLGKLSGTPSYNDDFLTDGTLNLDQSGGGTGQTYTTGTSIVETATHRQTFTPNNDPLKSITIDINDTGDDPTWTLTVHDANNVVIGSKTIAFASVATGDNVFTFTTPLRLTIGNTYHFHVTTSTTTGAPKVTSNVASDLEGAEFSNIFGILIADSNFHPMLDFDDGSTGILVIGNERYLAVWDEDAYEPNKIIFPPGYKCWSLTKTDEYIIAGCFRGDDIDAVEDARLFFWDGISPTLNFSRPLSMGAPLALTNYKNNLLGIYGTQGELYKGSEQFQRISKVPKLARGKKIQVLPGAISSWQGLTVIGIGANTDDAIGVEQGVYVWGNKDDKLPEVLAYMGAISTGTTQGTGLEIGMVQGFGKDLCIGYKDSAICRVDKIMRTDNPVTAGSWESRVFDGGNPDKEKLALKVKITFEALESGETVTPKYKIDRAASFTTGDTVSTVGATSAEVTLYSRFKEIEFGFNFTTSTTFITITGIEFTYDDMSSEKVV